MKDGTIWTRMVCYYSLANQWAWKEKNSQESLIKGEDPERQDIEQQNSSHQALQGELPSLWQPTFKIRRQINATLHFLLQVDVEAGEPEMVFIDRVKVKCGLIIIDNPSRDPSHSDFLVKSKEIWNESIFADYFPNVKFSDFHEI